MRLKDIKGHNKDLHNSDRSQFDPGLLSGSVHILSVHIEIACLLRYNLRSI